MDLTSYKILKIEAIKVANNISRAWKKIYRLVEGEKSN